MHPPPLPMGPSRRAAGFTLIELMVVITIVSILVLSMRSSFRKYQANKHTIAAAAEIVRMGRRARAESMGLGRAHLLYFQPGGGANGFGTATLLRGNALHCDHENWAPLIALCRQAEEQAPSSACAGHIDLGMTDWYYRPHAIVMRRVPPGQEQNANAFVTAAAPSSDAHALCYDAFGRVFWSNSSITASMTFSSASTGINFRGAFTFVVGLLNEDDPGLRYPGLVLSFPLGGNPRRLR